MGIRIHKILGYGWNDFQGFNKDIRLSDKFKSENEYYNCEDNELTWENFYIFCKEKYDAIHKQYPKEEDRFDIDGYFYLSWIVNRTKESSYKESKGTMFYDCVIYDPEFGNKKVIIFTIPWNEDWNRYDDIIDYYEYKGKNLKSKVELLKRPIYPYDFYIDNRTGNKLNYQHIHTYRLFKDTMEKEKSNNEKITLLRELNAF